jgi:hypothetical protein
MTLLTLTAQLLCTCGAEQARLAASAFRIVSLARIADA